MPGVLTLDDPSLAHQAALAGAGYAYLARLTVESDLAAGRLQSVLDEWLPDEPGLFLYYPKSRHPSAGLRALLDLVARAEPPRVTSVPRGRSSSRP